MGLYELMKQAKTQEQRIWEKGVEIEGFDGDLWRQDAAGAWIYRWAYGMPLHQFGWEIDHITPKSLGGLDWDINLRPLHAENNRRRQNGPLLSFVSAVGNTNVRMIPLQHKSHILKALGYYH